MICNKCGKEIDNGEEICAACQAAEVESPTADSTTEAAPSTDAVEKAKETADIIKEKVKKADFSYIKKLPLEMFRFAKANISNIYSEQKAHKPNANFVDKIKLIAATVISVIVKGFKMTINDLKNVKTISKKRKHSYICSAVVLVLALVILSPSSSGSGNAAIAALYTESALPSGLEQAVAMGVYDDISIGEMVDYMFKNPDIDVKRGDNGAKIVTISGKYRHAAGDSTYAYSGTVVYKVSKSGSVSVKSDPDNIDKIMESIAVTVGKN